MSSVVRPRVVRTRPFALVSVVLFAGMTMVAAQLVTDGPGTTQPPLRAQRAALHTQQAALKEAAAAMAAAIVRPITPPPAPAPAPPTTTTTTTTVPPTPAPAPALTPPPAPAPAATVAAAPAPSDPGVLPAVGQATAWGCAAALTYLQAYAAKGFALECPGYAQGREAMTCMNQPGACPGTSVIAIADPCPQAYMNEASNSYVITGVADTPIDPFGPCP
ncbi:MAG TPA: hypothetical protein VIJ56_10050 [Acidimicrobiales bacterium]